MLLVRPVLAVLLILAGATVALAQGARPERPFRGLFGGDNEGAQQGLILSGTLGAGYDTDLEAEARRATSLPINTDAGLGTGPLGQFSGAATYSLSTSTSSFSASGGTTGRYYPTADTRDIVRRDYASVQASTRLGLGLTVFGSGSYSPLRLSDIYGIVDSSLDTPGADFEHGSSSEHYIFLAGGGAWEHELTRRTAIGANYRYGTRATSIDAPEQHLHRAGLSLRHNLSRGLNLVFGYLYTEASYGSGEDYVTHGVNAGVDFNRALSVSRRTTLSFSTGTTAFDDPSTPEGLRFRAVGSATLHHEIGRTWNAALSYGRSLRFSETLMSPIFSDTLTLAFGGLVSRRFQVHTAAGAVTGRGAVNTNSGGFDQYYGSARATYALGRYAGLGAAYTYNRHRFGNDMSLERGVPRTSNRHGVQVYMTVWMPVFQHAGTP